MAQFMQTLGNVMLCVLMVAGTAVAVAIAAALVSGISLGIVHLWRTKR